MKNLVFYSVLFALIDLVFSPLAVVHASTSPASPLHIATLSGHTDGVRSVSFSPDGAVIVSGSFDGTIKLWDVKLRRVITTLEGSEVSLPRDRSLLTNLEGGAVSFSPNKNKLTFVSGSYDGTLRLWDVETGQIITTFSGHTDEVTSVSFSPDGSMIASTAWDDRVKLWDVETGTNLVTLIDEPLWGWVTSVSFSPDGKTLATGSREGKVRLWDVETRTNVAILVDVPKWEEVRSVSFAPYGTMLASGLRNGVVEVWDVETDQKLATFDRDTEEAISSVSFSPDGEILASGSFDGTIQLWDTSEWIPPRPQKLVKIGDGQRGLIGEQLAAPFVVSVLDQNGSAFAGAVVSFSVTAGGGTLSTATATTNANGRVSTRLTLGSELGPNTVEATVNGIEVVTFTATSVVQIPHSLTKISGDGQEGPASTQLAEPFVISVLDEDGAAMAEVDVTFAVTAGGGMLLAATDADPCTIAPSTSSTTETTDANGQATTHLMLGSDPGTNTVEATVEGLEPATFTATAAEQATPHRLTKVCGEDQEGTVGTQLAEPFVVSVMDEDGAAMAGVDVSFAVTAGGGTLSATTATSNANGRARTRLTLGSDPGTNTVEVSVEGLESVAFTATGQEDPLVSLFDFFGSGKRVALPDSPQLAQNAPNPFNSQTVLAYFLHAPGPARVEVFSLSGQRIAVLRRGPQEAGYHRLGWDGRDDASRPVASGMYLYRLVTDEVVLTRKLILLR